jgi:hypothetical protein
MRKSAVHFLDCREVHGSILANGSVRTTAGLNAHDALGWKSFRARQDELVFFRIDVIRDHVDLVVVAKPLAERFDESGFPRPNRAADSDAQGMCM